MVLHSQASTGPQQTVVVAVVACIEEVGCRLIACIVVWKQLLQKCSGFFLAPIGAKFLHSSSRPDKHTCTQTYIRAHTHRLPFLCYWLTLSYVLQPAGSFFPLIFFLSLAQLGVSLPSFSLSSSVCSCMVYTYARTHMKASQQVE